MIVSLRAKTKVDLLSESLTSLLSLELESEPELKDSLLLRHGYLDENGNIIEHIDLVVIDAQRIVALAVSYNLTAITLDFHSYESKLYLIVANLLALHALWPGFLACVL